MNSDYKPPQAVAVFLVKFDMRSGYELVWSKTTGSIDLSGIEFKVLPSGIHEFSEDLILFTHIDKEQIYYGISKFRQMTLRVSSETPTGEGEEQLENPFVDPSEAPVDRKNIKMYSLGCLCLPVKTEWTPDTYISNGFEYIGGLDEYLVDFLHSDSTNYEALEQIDLNHLPINKFNNPIVNLLKFFNNFGPLIFTLYKLSLTRPRIIIFNQSKCNNYLVETFNYLISVLSLIPQKLKINSQIIASHLGKDQDFIRPLYNISLNDLESPLLKLPSFIATTNDDILMYQPVYDYAIVLNNDAQNPSPKILSFAEVNKQSHLLKSTFNDYTKFKIVYQQLIDKSEIPNNKSIDNLSIKTSNSFFSNFKFFGGTNPGSSLRVGGAVMNYEPNWWLKDSTYPISWTQYIWSAFSWFASAGQYSDLDQQGPQSPTGPHPPGKYHGNSNMMSQNSSSANLLSVPGSRSSPLMEIQESISHEDYLQYIEIIGYFHKLTKKWVYLINEVIIDQNSPDIELTYQDLIDLELDPYNKDDHAFIVEFTKTYWDIESVEISSGLSFFC